MRWNKYTIETTTEAEDYMSSMLMELGIEGVEIEDKIPLSEDEQADMFIDFLPELPPDDGVSYVSFYIEDDGSTAEIYPRCVLKGCNRSGTARGVGQGCDDVH